jgi:hypothetical protein
MQPARQQCVAGLAAEEGDGFAGIDRRAHHRAAGAVDAAREVDRMHAGRGVHGLDHGAREALHRSVETGTEQRVDNGVGRRQSLRHGRRASARPTLRRQRRVTLEPTALAEKEHACAIAALGQNARRYKAVTAIVAGSGDDRDLRSRRMARANAVGDRAAGIFHERDTGSTARNSQAVGLRHLGRGQQFDHGCNRVAPRPSARYRVDSLAVTRGYASLIMDWANCSSYDQALLMGDPSGLAVAS